MVTIHNADIQRELQAGAKTQTAIDPLPNRFANEIMPVFEVNPKMLRVLDISIHATQATTGAITVYTTPAGKDFYLTGFHVCLYKDATCDIATGFVALSITNKSSTVACQIQNIPVITLTAQTIVGSWCVLDKPILLGRGSAITLSGTFTAGVMQRAAVILGYTVEGAQ